MEILIKYFNEIVDCFQVRKVIVRYVDTNAEIKTSIPAVNYFKVSKFNKISMLGISNSDYGVYFFDQFLLFVIVEIHVPLGEASLASPILDEYESNLAEQVGSNCSVISTQLIDH